MRYAGWEFFINDSYIWVTVLFLDYYSGISWRCCLCIEYCCLFKYLHCSGMYICGTISTCCLVVRICFSLFIFHCVVKWFTFVIKFCILLCTLVVIQYTYVLVYLGTYWKLFIFSDLEVSLKMQFNLRIVEMNTKLLYNFHFARIVYLLR